MNKFIEFCFALIFIFAIVFLGVVTAMKLAPLQIEITDAMFLEEATKRFAAQREYNITTYDCNNYSADFQSVMGEFGFDLVTIHGYPESGTGHAWNAISFEPQGSGFKDFRDKYPFRRVLAKD